MTASLYKLVDVVENHSFPMHEALLSINQSDIETLLHNRIDPNELPNDGNCIAKGLNASPGALSGKVIIYHPDRHDHKIGSDSIVICKDLKPKDIGSITHAGALVILSSGVTSHAAVIARQIGIPCIVGLAHASLDIDSLYCKIGDHFIHENELITVDGSSGYIYARSMRIIPPDQYTENLLGKITKWADQYKTIGIRANADTPEEAIDAIKWGAEGIGVCRTEHMFLDDNTLPHIQKLLHYNDTEWNSETHINQENDAIDFLHKRHTEELIKIFLIMKSLPVIIRLLDAPIDEFIGQQRSVTDEASKQATIVRESTAKIPHEVNPMLGFRGVRLGILRPRIYEMQIDAIIESACICSIQHKININPKIMIPIIGYEGELEIISNLVDSVASRVFNRLGVKISYSVGIMIETPRAALIADKLALRSDFFSFGTNDLTQATCVISRDDAENSFIPRYIELGIMTSNPFQTIDANAVGMLVRSATNLGRATCSKVNKMFEVGICGEHGGDYESVIFFCKIGLDYVSCAPKRIPIAKLAAAHAYLNSFK